MNGLPAYDYSRADRLADIADSENNARAADAFFADRHADPVWTAGDGGSQPLPAVHAGKALFVQVLVADALIEALTAARNTGALSDAQRLELECLRVQLLCARLHAKGAT